MKANDVVEGPGSVIWITGLAASGKTTFMNRLRDEVLERGIHPVCLDGDDLRVLLGRDGSHYSYEERRALGFQYSSVCQYIAEQGHVVLIATIALFHEVQAWNRMHLPNLIEVLMDTPLDTLRERDPKNLYLEHEESGSSELVGLSWAAEFPKSPDFTVAPDEGNQASALKEIVNAIMAIHGRVAGHCDTCAIE